MSLLKVIVVVIDDVDGYDEMMVDVKEGSDVHRSSCGCYPYALMESAQERRKRVTMIRSVSERAQVARPGDGCCPWCIVSCRSK